MKPCDLASLIEEKLSDSRIALLKTGVKLIVHKNNKTKKERDLKFDAEFNLKCSKRISNSSPL